MELFAKHPGVRLVLGPRGEVCSIRRHTSEFCVPAAEAFTMQLLDRKGNALDLKSSEFTFDGTACTGHPALPSLTVTVAVSSDGDMVRFRPRVTGVPDEWVLSWFDGPQIVYPMRRAIKLLLPLFDGVVIDNPKDHKYHPIGFSKRGTPYGAAFPGRAQFQFMALYRENEGGVYFAAHDPHNTTKAVNTTHSICQGHNSP